MNLEVLKNKENTLFFNSTGNMVFTNIDVKGLVENEIVKFLINGLPKDVSAHIAKFLENWKVIPNCEHHVKDAMTELFGDEEK